MTEASNTHGMHKALLSRCRMSPYDVVLVAALVLVAVALLDELWQWMAGA